MIGFEKTLEVRVLYIVCEIIAFVLKGVYTKSRIEPNRTGQ